MKVKVQQPTRQDQQPTLLPRKHGGLREGAGRKRADENFFDPRHITREALNARHPVHVMLRTRDDVPRLRQRKMYNALRRVLMRYVGRWDFRIVHISIQRNHIHLIVEAKNALHLTRGMQSFGRNAAYAINGVALRKGKVFKFRYKAKQIRTRRYARNAIAYVLNNWRRHREDVRHGNAVLDRYSSAISFEGWTQKREWQPPADYNPLPVSSPRTGLLQSTWKRFGLIDPFEVPGPVSRQTSLAGWELL